MKKEITITAADMLKEDFSRQEMHAIASTMLDRLYNGGSEPRDEAPKGIRIEHYKGQECIIFPSITGKEFALYPHYKKLPFVEEENRYKYKAEAQTEVEALYDMDCAARTDELMEADSPAAKYAREIGFDIPTLGVLVGMMRHKDEINELAKQIGGDLIDDLNRWSSCRYGSGLAWYYYHSGICGGYCFYHSLPVAAVSAFEI